jgi:hypothetical protein
MKVIQSAVIMSSQTKNVEFKAKEENVKFWNSAVAPKVQDSKNGVVIAQTPIDSVELSFDYVRKRAEDQGMDPTVLNDPDMLTISEKDKQKIFLIQKMFESITGKRFQFYMISNIRLDSGDPALPTSPQAATGQPATAAQNALTNGQPVGWGFEMDVLETRVERQEMTFHSQGSILTQDGKAIQFDVSLHMSREFYEQTSLSIRGGDAVLKDPLVLNYGGAAPELTDLRFSFDIDNDGTSDQISFLQNGSGFLALDADGNGTIDHGGELFGTASGDGFADLARHDGDGNGWIDENDAIYDKLRIFTKDETGRDVLFALGQKGIGAIFLGNVSSLFEIRDTSNEPAAVVQKSGVFVREDGTAGTVHHLDLVL